MSGAQTIDPIVGGQTVAVEQGSRWKKFQLREAVSLSAGASKQLLIQTIPAGAFVTNIELKNATVVDLSSATGFGLGVAADPDQLGKTTTLTKNASYKTGPGVGYSSSPTLGLFPLSGAAAAGTFGAASTAWVSVDYLLNESLHDAD